MKDEKQVTMKNGRPAISGTCSVCGTKMFKIGSGGGGAKAVARKPAKAKAKAKAKPKAKGKGKK
jgi:hypothetical protein